MIESDCWVSRESLSEEVTFKLRPKEPGTSCGTNRWKSIPTSGNTRAKTLGKENVTCRFTEPKGQCGWNRMKKGDSGARPDELGPFTC